MNKCQIGHSPLGFMLDGLDFLVGNFQNLLVGNLSCRELLHFCMICA
jgi:hypothetical protein